MIAAAGPETAHAQATYYDDNTKPIFQREGEGRPAARPPRRAAVTTTTNLDDFDIPRRTARSVTSPTRATAPRRATTRIVERKRTTRNRVRVAALTRTSGVSQAAVRRPTATRTRVAALGTPTLPVARAPSTSLTGGGIAWRASSACLAGNLRSVVGTLASSYGRVTVNSTCRSVARNRRVGGAKRSWHLTGNAVDFRIHGANVRTVYAYLRSTVGGLKHYGGGRFHIDNGPRRTF